MKLKKNTLNVMLVLGFVLVGTIFVYRYAVSVNTQSFITERNKLCADLSLALTNESGVDDCYCYFEGFKTGDSSFDSKTLPLCACECMVNGTSVKVGLVEPRSSY